MRTRWTLARDDAHAGKASVGFLQLRPDGPHQIFLTLNGWDFAWIAFFGERDKAQLTADAMAEKLSDLSRDASTEGLRRYEAYLEEITASSEFPVPEQMESAIQEDLRIRTAERVGHMLTEATQRSQFPVPLVMDEPTQVALREYFQETMLLRQGWKQPEYTVDLSLFQLFYEQNRQQITATGQSMQRAMLSGEFAHETYDPYLLQEVAMMG